MSAYRGIRTQAYVVEEVGGPFVLQDIVLDEVRDDEVLVEMSYTGLCHTVRIHLAPFLLDASERGEND